MTNVAAANAALAISDAEAMSVQDDETGLADALDRYRAAVVKLIASRAKSREELAERARIALKYETMTGPIGGDSIKSQNPLAWDVLQLVAKG